MSSKGIFCHKTSPLMPSPDSSGASSPVHLFLLKLSLFPSPPGCCTKYWPSCFLLLLPWVFTLVHKFIFSLGFEGVPQNLALLPDGFWEGVVANGTYPSFVLENTKQIPMLLNFRIFLFSHFCRFFTSTNCIFSESDDPPFHYIFLLSSRQCN